AWLLAPGQLDQRVDAGPRNAGDDGAVMRPDPALDRERVSNPRPARPLVFEWDANLRHRPPLRQEYILDHPVEAAGPTQPGDVPAARDDLRFRARKDAAPVEGAALREPDRLVVIPNHLEAPQHPGRLLATAAELPPARDSIAARDGHRPTATRHR